MNLKTRLQRLEATPAPASTDTETKEAIKELLDKLDELLPSDKPELGIYPMDWQSSTDKIRALATRITGDATTSDDMALLASLPESALQVFGTTAAGWVVFIASLDARC